MSTSIYNALHWKNCSSIQDQIVSCTEYLRPHTVKCWQDKMFQKMIFRESLLTASTDHVTHWLVTFFRNGVYHSKKEDDSTKYKDTVVRGWMDPVTNEWYGNISSEITNPHALLIQAGMGVDFSYWNQTDPDPNVSETEWSHRYDVWNRIDLDQPFFTNTLTLTPADFECSKNVLSCMHEYIFSNTFVEDARRNEMHKTLDRLEQMGLLPTVSSCIKALDDPVHNTYARINAEFLVQNFRDGTKSFFQALNSSFSDSNAIYSL